MYDYTIVLDLEMNPVEKSNIEARKILHQEIIEIGAVKVSNYGQIVDQFSCFVKPQYSKNVCWRITQLTGISTNDVLSAETFERALSEFATWIGDGKIRICSWSECDKVQIINECLYNNIPLPPVFHRWIDLQKIFPRIMHLNNYKDRLSLSEATELCGFSFAHASAHRALYDATKTSEILISVLTGEYKLIREHLCSISAPASTVLTYSLGEIFGSIFSNDISLNNQSLELER